MPSGLFGVIFFIGGLILSCCVVGEKDATGGMTGVLATLTLDKGLEGLCLVGEMPAEAGGIIGVEAGGCKGEEYCFSGDPKPLAEYAEDGRWRSKELAKGLWGEERG